MEQRYYMMHDRSGLKESWLRVPYYELKDLNLLNNISEESFFDNEHGYLHNEVDMLLFLTTKYETYNLDSFLINYTEDKIADIGIFECFSEGLKHYLDFVERHSISSPNIIGSNGCYCHPFDTWEECHEHHNRNMAIGNKVKNRCHGRVGQVHEINATRGYYTIKYGELQSDLILQHAGELNLMNQGKQLSLI